jgi:microbial collagenase
LKAFFILKITNTGKKDSIMKLKKSISLIILALSTHAVHANSTRDGAYYAVNVDNQDVEHSRTTQSYVPKALLSLKDKQYDDGFMPATSAIKKRSKLRSTTSVVQLSTLASLSDSGCSDAVFTSLKGANLLEALRDNGRNCIDTLFNDEPETLALGAYSDANLTTVINEIKAKSLIYDGTDTDGYFSALFYWLKAYAYYDNRRFVNTTSQQAMEDAVNALYASSHFFDRNAENGLVVRNALGILKNAEIAERFVHVAKGVMSRYDESFESVSNWGSAISPLFWQALQSCSRDVECRTQEHNLALINAITGFIDNNISWLAKPDNDYHLFNLGYQLVNLYESKDEPHFDAMETKLSLEINEVLNNYGPLESDKERTLYLAVLESVNYNNECTTYNVCNKTDDIITSVLNDRMTCPSGTLFIWAQDMTQAQLEWSCNSLGTHETYFHETLATNEVPVSPDDNDKLHMVIFNDKKEWVTYGGALFNVSTSNGGTYREGDPSTAGDQATFYAYEHVAERPIFDVWNLRHEYIHYLEGRFISKGSFRDSDSAGRTTWFGEGIAEYISLRECNDGAIEEARAGEYALSTIFNNEYGVGQTRIYDWGYLSNRYMFERENAKFFSMLNLFKQGDFQAYRDELVDPWVSNKTFDADFSSWLTTVESTGCTIDTTRPLSPVEPVNIDNIQGDDQVGINACALGRSPESSNIKAGSAICLTDTNNGNQVQLGLSVPSGLENVSLEITLRHGTGNADLLHRWNNRPNNTEFDHMSNDATNNETIMVTPVVAGWNYIHVRAADEFSNVTLLARYIQNDGLTVDNVLEKGVSKLVSGRKGEDVHFIMDVPVNVSAVTFDTSNGSGDSDIYVKFGSAPTISDYDCRPYQGGNTEHCEINPAQAGVYYVMLRGYNDFTDVNLVGNYTMNSSNVAPTAFVNGPFNATVGEIVTMNSSNSSDVDGSIVSQLWDFGDGSTSSAAIPNHAYLSAGTYNVSLTVTDNEGSSSSVSTTATIVAASSSSDLLNGVVKLVSGVAGGERVYMMIVPAGASNLSFNTRGGTGDVDMHVKFGSEATKTDYDCRPWKVGSNETCNINNVQAGTYYIMLLGYSNFTEVELIGNYNHSP